LFEELGEGPFYTDPRQDVVFGDIFAADFLRDIFVRDDTRLMGGGPLPATLAPKVAGWMNTKLAQGTIDLYSPAFPPKPETRYALAHASFHTGEEPRQAILVSDSCLAATALAQGRQKRSVGGRLLFAPLTVVDGDKWRTLVEAEDFERFPLPMDARLPKFSVAELANCFMVDARDVKSHATARVASLTQTLAEELEVHWNAYATRRGPRAYARNTLKLASLLSGGGQPDDDKQRAADAIADVLDLALVIEGSDLESVSEAEEAVRISSADARALTPQIVDRIARDLQELAQLASDAAKQLTAIRDS
jgi:hypothetical protein